MKLMKRTKIALLGASLAAFLLPAAAQTSSTPTVPSSVAPTVAPNSPSTTAPNPGTTAPQPDTGKQIRNQKAQEQQRIANGMKDGQLTSGEAGQLENKESAINKEEQNMKNADGGHLTAADRAKLQNQQNRVSGQIYKDKHNDVTRSTNPESGASGRELHQENRIDKGVASGQLTSGEASKLEAQHNNIKEQIAHDREANGGHLTSQEKSHINNEQSHLSKKIYKDKHNGTKR
jgi:hypothetical protein